MTTIARLPVLKKKDRLAKVAKVAAYMHGPRTDQDTGHRRARCSP